MLVDVGEVRKHIKPKADSTLHNMRKSELIEYIRCLEHNYNVAVSFNENQVKYIESLHLNEWISKSEQMPERGQRVIVRYRADNPCVDNYRVADMFYEIIDGRSIWDAIGKKVTHWMPMPKLPEEKNDG